MFLKKLLLTVVQIGILYLFYRIGVFIQHTFHLFIPGSIIGMLLFFMLLMVWKPFHRFIEKGAGFFLSHLPIFFIPATVGVMEYFDLFKGSGIWLIVITIFSTLLVLIVSALTSRFIMWLKRRMKE